MRILQPGDEAILEQFLQPHIKSSMFLVGHMRAAGLMDNGRSAVATSLLAVREEGVHTAILFTGEENIPAQKAYEALGFYKIGDYRITLLKEPLTQLI